MSAAANARNAQSQPEVSDDAEVLAGAPAPASDGITGADHKAHQSRFTKMREHFASQPRVKVRLAKDDVRGDQLVKINGYAFYIQRGVSVEVPEGVAEILEQAGLI